MSGRAEVSRGGAAVWRQRVRQRSRAQQGVRAQQQTKGQAGAEGKVQSWSLTAYWSHHIIICLHNITLGGT